MKDGLKYFELTVFLRKECEFREIKMIPAACRDQLGLYGLFQVRVHSCLHPTGPDVISVSGPFTSKIRPRIPVMPKLWRRAVCIAR